MNDLPNNTWDEALQTWDATLVPWDGVFIPNINIIIALPYGPGDFSIGFP